jgi:hypothetical protein
MKMPLVKNSFYVLKDGFHQANPCGLLPVPGVLFFRHSDMARLAGGRSV